MTVIEPELSLEGERFVAEKKERKKRMWVSKKTERVLF